MSPITPEVRAVLAGPYGIGRLDQLLEDLRPLLELEEPARVTVDLHQLGFIVPSTAAVLCAALQRLVKLDLRIAGESRIQPPDDDGVKNYLLRLDVIQAGAGMEIDEPFVRRASIGFHECQPFATEREATEVARELTQALDEGCDLDDDAHRDQHFSCRALLQRTAPCFHRIGWRSCSSGLPAAAPIRSRDRGPWHRNSTEPQPES